MTFRFPDPSPDFRRIETVLELGEPDRLSFFEIHIDHEMQCAILEENPIPVPPNDWKSARERLRQSIRFWHRSGHEFIPVFMGFGMPAARRVTNDTAEMSRGQRGWREEEFSQIASFEQFERYPWAPLGAFNLESFEMAAEEIPEGMAILAVVGAVLEHASDIMGTQSLLMAMVEQPELVDAVCKRITDRIVAAYEKLCAIEPIRFFCLGDDWGFKSAPFANPAAIRRYFLPAVTQVSELAHQTGRKMVFHACGNMYPLMNDLIETAKIDGKHSFEDVILPAGEFKRAYGKRVATLGGVDVDRFSRDESEPFRKYVRKVIEECAPGGGFAIGSGNSVTNYCRVENFRVYLEEVWRAGNRK